MCCIYMSVERLSLLKSVRVQMQDQVIRCTFVRPFSPRKIFKALYLHSVDFIGERRVFTYVQSATVPCTPKEIPLSPQSKLGFGIQRPLALSEDQPSTQKSTFRACSMANVILRGQMLLRWKFTSFSVGLLHVRDYIYLTQQLRRKPISGLDI